MPATKGTNEAARSAIDETFDSSLYPPQCPYEIKRPPMTMTWEQLTLLHWRYPAEEVQRLLPKGLSVETFDGSAWVGLVPFRMSVSLPGLSIGKRWLNFPETNVRTYVRGKSNKPGVWFFSLEASSLPAVVTARTGYQVPYFWADMSIDCDTSSNSIRYASSRRWPGPKGTTSTVEVAVGEGLDAAELSDLDNFLTARWALYGAIGPRISYAKMHHEPWPLYHADLVHCDDELVAASGLSQPEGDPILHYSPKVSVRCGWPRRPPRS